MDSRPSGRGDREEHDSMCGFLERVTIRIKDYFDRRGQNWGLRHFDCSNSVHFQNSHQKFAKIEEETISRTFFLTDMYTNRL